MAGLRVEENLLRSSWFLIEKIDTMGMLFTVEDDEVREEDFIYCNVCKTRIGTTDDHIENVQISHHSLSVSVLYFRC